MVPSLSSNPRSDKRRITEPIPLLHEIDAQHHLPGLRSNLTRFLAPFELRLLKKRDKFLPDYRDLFRGDSDSIGKVIMALQGDTQRPPIADGRELRRVAGLPRNEQIEKEHGEIKKKIIEKYTASEAKAVETAENRGDGVMGPQESIEELWNELSEGKEPFAAADE